MGTYFIPLARGTGRFFVDFIRCFGCWFPAFRKPSRGNRPTSSCRSFKAGRSHPVRPVLGEEEFLFFISGICYMLSVSPFPVSVANEGFFGGSPVENDKKSWLVTGRRRNQAKFFHVSYLWKTKHQPKGRENSHQSPWGILPVKKAVRGRASSAIRWRIK